ncbi:hypothetical protein L1887_03434 [Cichorium endivia]|nr:hypothetical protein L1887_03434 [Cichorium endivia]
MSTGPPSHRSGSHQRTAFDAQPTMEETVLVGDDLMSGPPSPLVPPEIASHVLQGVNLCDGIPRKLFLYTITVECLYDFFYTFIFSNL